MIEGLRDKPQHWQPVQKPPVLPSERFHVRRLGAKGTGPLTVYLFHDVAEELLFAAEFRPAQCSAALLTGGFFSGLAGHYLEIRGFRDAQVLDKIVEYGRDLRRSQTDAARSLATDDALRTVGLAVSRPGCGGRLGADEILLYLSYFGLPYQVVWMLDPRAKLCGLYWHGGTTDIKNVGFNLIESVLPTRSETANGNRPSQGARDPGFTG